MADTKISALSAAAALDGTEVLPAVQSAANVKVTVNQIGTFLGSGVLRGDAMDSYSPVSNYAPLLALTNGIPVLAYDGGSTNESALWKKRLPSNFSGTLDFSIRCVMASATSGNVRWGVQIMRLNADVTVDSFDTASEAHGAVSADADDPTTVSITGVSVDGAAAGEEILISIYRDASDTTNDTASGDAYLLDWTAE